MRLNIIKLLLEYDTHLTAPCAVNDVFSWSRDDVMYTHIGSLSPTPLPLLSHSSSLHSFPLLLFLPHRVRPPRTALRRPCSRP